MSAASWNSGTPTAVTMIDETHFTVESFRGEAKVYEVNLEIGCCSCPHYGARLAGTGQQCKHLEAVKAQAPFLKALARAKELTDEALDQYLAKYAGHVVVGGALRLVRAQRRAEALRQAKIGTSVRLKGNPANEALKELFR